MNTLKILSLSTLLGALLASGPAVAEDSPGTRIFGSFTQQDGITLPADLRHQAAQSKAVASEPPQVERVYGAFYRDESGVVRLLADNTSPARTTSNEHRPQATYTLPGDELVFGSFVRINGIAMPASMTRGTGANDRDPITRDVATRQDR